MSTILPPFSCSFSPSIPELLHELNATLVVTTYQAGKMIFLSAPTSSDIVQLPRNFDMPMGVAISKDKLGVASKNEITTFRNSPGHAADYPDQPNVYDNIYVPKATYYTGNIDAHDLVFANKGLVAVNTTFSCLATIDDDYSFKPFWKPSFISDIQPGDRCHLNGLALLNGEPEYVTCLGKSDEPQGWRANKLKGGLLIHVPTNEIVLDNLSMPHSPRIYGDKLYVLNSAAGELISMDLATRQTEVVKKLPYFLRGMARMGDYLFIGLSKIRQTSSAFKDLPIAETAQVSGIAIMYLPYKSIIGTIKYENSVDEIYDLQILENQRRPGLMNTTKDTFRKCIVTPDSSYWVLPKKTAE